MTIQNCLVVGGAGFIGSHIVETLLAKNYTVRVLDNFTTGTLSNLRHVLDHIELIPGDIRQVDTVAKACQGIDAVYHQAAIASVAQCTEDPLGSHDVNVTGTLNVLEQAKRAGVQKVMFASSAAVYGANPEPIKTEDMPPSPISKYGIDKLTGENYCRYYGHASDMDVICFRYFNVFGPRQLKNSHYSGVLTIFVNTLLAKGAFKLYGTGEQTRDFVHVHDIVQANLLALKSPPKGFSLFNVATRQEYSLLTILNWLQQQVSETLDIEYLPERRHDLRQSLGCIESITRELGYTPQKEFFKGLQEFIEYTQEGAHHILHLPSTHPLLLQSA
jgi:UDP-glucose 4-epimerase